MAMEDIFRCADEMDFAPVPNIESGFFANDFEITDNFKIADETTGDQYPNMDSGIPLSGQGIRKKQHSVPKNWQQCINRAFMIGLTANDILKSIGNEIMEMENAPEILAYIKKYEGLMGTVFVDISVLDDGFPYSRIPKKFHQFHRFAVNCKNRKQFKSRAFTGQTSGDIENFLNAEEQLEEVSKDVCEKTGLPVYKKGLFTKQVIRELLSLLGEEDGDFFRLQELLKEKVLGIQKKQKTNTEIGDFNYGLKEQPLDVEIAPEAFFAQDEDLNLQEQVLQVQTTQPPQTVPNVKLDYRASNDSDILFEKEAPSPMDVKMDGELRF